MRVGVTTVRRAAIAAGAVSASRMAPPWGPVRRFALDGRLTSDDGARAVFHRAGRAWRQDGSETAAGEPRYEAMALASPSDAVWHANEIAAGTGVVMPQCDRDGALYGIRYGSAEIYRSDDGFRWQATRTSGGAVARVFAPAGGGLIVALTGPPVTIRWSEDDGATLQEAVLDGAAGFALQANAALHYHSIRQGGNGTVILAEYANTAGVPVRLYRSVDGGRSWTAVFEYSTPHAAPSTIGHWHTVCRQEALGWWIAVAGDVGNARLARSTDDGRTWSWITAPGQLFFQPVGLIDYGHATRLLCGSDTNDQIAVLDLDPATGQVASIEPVYCDNDRARPYFWPVGYRDGVFWAACSDYNAGTRTATVVVSRDLANWAVLHRLTGAGDTVCQLAGFCGGRAHWYVNRGGAIGHLSVGAPDVRTARALLVEPGVTNLLDTPNRSSAETDASDWVSQAGATTIEAVADGPWTGGRCVHVRRADGNSIVVIGAAAAVSAGTVCCGTVRLRSDVPGSRAKVQWWSVGRGAAVGDLYVVSTGRAWQEVLLKPYTADASDGSVRIQVTVYAQAGVPADGFIDGVQIAAQPVSWQEGGTPRSAETVEMAVRAGAAWSHTFVIAPVAMSAFNSGGPLFVRSWRADAANAAEFYFDPSDQTFALRRTVAGAAQNPVKTAATHFHRHAAIAVCLSSDADGLTLRLLNGGETLTAADAALPALNDAMVGVTTGDRTGANALPVRLCEDRFWAGAADALTWARKAVS